MHRHATYSFLLIAFMSITCVEKNGVVERMIANGEMKSIIAPKYLSQSSDLFTRTYLTSSLRIHRKGNGTFPCRRVKNADPILLRRR